jgi:hypothetical protein
MRLMNILKQPLNAGVFGAIIGLLIGLTIGWVIWPTEWTDATPQAMSADHQVDYLRMAIDAYKVNPDPELAWIRYQNLGLQNARAAMDEIKKDPGKQDVGAIMAFGDVIRAKLESGGQGTASDAGNANAAGNNNSADNTATTGSGTGNLLLLGGLGVLALFVIVAVVYFARRYLLKPQTAPENYSPARQAQEIAKTAEKTDFSKMGLQDPITRTMTTYMLGDDLYDESFSIDSPGGEFLGEYGVGVSEAIGVGEPKKVTAIEVWLFDKNDIKTATKVLMTPHAYNDPNIRQRLEAKGELALAEPQGQALLETATLQLLATLVDLEFGKGSMPDKSYFERVTLELAIWPKG